MLEQHLLERERRYMLNRLSISTEAYGGYDWLLSCFVGSGLKPARLNPEVEVSTITDAILYGPLGGQWIAVDARWVHALTGVYTYQLSMLTHRPWITNAVYVSDELVLGPHLMNPFYVRPTLMELVMAVRIANKTFYEKIFGDTNQFAQDLYQRGWRVTGWRRFVHEYKTDHRLGLSLVHGKNVLTIAAWDPKHIELGLQEVGLSQCVFVYDTLIALEGMSE